MQLLIEAIVVGIITLVIKTLIDKIMSKYIPNFALIILTGFIIHILCEFSGINKWYCKNGYACLNK